MKIQIIHNPTSGNGRHKKEDLIKFLEGFGNEISYVSTQNEDWISFMRDEPGQIIIAGGDGTIRKVAEVLLSTEFKDRERPDLRLFPLGTANNISEALKIPAEREIPKPEGKREDFDYGSIKGLEKEHFFLESVGFGIFPELIFETEKRLVEEEDATEEMNNVLNILLQSVKRFHAQKAEITANGITITGMFLMVEVMNIKFLGPNLKFAPGAVPGDGFFDLAIISERNRPELIRYIENLLSRTHQDVELEKFIWTLPVQTVSMNWKGPRMHIDDMLIKSYSGGTIEIKSEPGAFHFVK